MYQRLLKGSVILKKILTLLVFCFFAPLVIGEQNVSAQVPNEILESREENGVRILTVRLDPWVPFLYYEQLAPATDQTVLFKAKPVGFSDLVHYKVGTFHYGMHYWGGEESWLGDPLSKFQQLSEYDTKPFGANGLNYLYGMELTNWWYEPVVYRFAGKVVNGHVSFSEMDFDY